MLRAAAQPGVQTNQQYFVASPSKKEEERVLYKGRFTHIVLVEPSKTIGLEGEQLVCKKPRDWSEAGQVYKADGEPWVSRLREDDATVQRAKREISHLRGLNHKNICKSFIEEGEQESLIYCIFYPYVLQELLDTYDTYGYKKLEPVPASAPLPDQMGTNQGMCPVSVLSPVGIDHKITNQLCLGLIYLHGKNIVHGSICPANLLMTENGTLKITDFSDALTKGDRFNLVDNENAEPAYLSPDRGSALSTLKPIKAAPKHDWWAAGIIGLQIHERDAHVLALKTKDVNKSVFLEYPTVEDVSQAVDKGLARIKAGLVQKRQDAQTRSDAHMSSLAMGGAASDEQSIQQSSITISRLLTQEIEQEMQHFDMAGACLQKWVVNTESDIGFSDGHTKDKTNLRAPVPPCIGTPVDQVGIEVVP